MQSHIWGRASYYMRKCANFSPFMRSRDSYMTLHPIPLNFLIYEENLIYFFSVYFLGKTCISNKFLSILKLAFKKTLEKKEIYHLENTKRIVVELWRLLNQWRLDLMSSLPSLIASYSVVQSMDTMHRKFRIPEFISSEKVFQIIIILLCLCVSWCMGGVGVRV